MPFRKNQFYALISRDMRITGDEFEPLMPGLGDQQSVERIAMMSRQRFDGQGVGMVTGNGKKRYLRTYLNVAGIATEGKDRPLFRSTVRRTKQLTGNSMTSKSICELVKRRLKDAKLPDRLSPHSFRVSAVTDLLTQGIPLEDVQYLTGHSGPAHDAALRPAAEEGHAEHRGADFQLTVILKRSTCHLPEFEWWQSFQRRMAGSSRVCS